jgi:hypothetical protein
VCFSTIVNFGRSNLFAEWYGWNGRGSWVVTRPPGATKSTLNVTVEYTPPLPPDSHILARRSLEEEAAVVGWSAGSTPREGQAWTGAIAELYAGQRQAEELATPVKSKTRKMSASVASRDITEAAESIASASPEAITPASLPPLTLNKAVLSTEPLSPTSPKRKTRTRRGTESSEVGAAEHGNAHNSHGPGAPRANGHGHGDRDGRRRRHANGDGAGSQYQGSRTASEQGGNGAPASRGRRRNNTRTTAG